METVRGVIAAVKFRNEQNGWTVLSLTASRDLASDTFFAVGTLPQVGHGETVELTGEWVEHHEYGRQFKFTNADIVVPDTAEAIEKYLGCGLIKGMRAVTAKNVVRLFGEDSLYVIEHTPELLSKVKGISPKRAMQIGESYAEQVGMRSAMMAMQGYGITTAQAAKLYKLYGDDCIKRINSNPYRLVEDVEGVGFKTADGIALSMGFTSDSAFRIDAGIKYVLNWAKSDGGHTCLESEALTASAARTLGVDESVVEEEIERLIIKNELSARQMDGATMVFLPSMYFCESSCANMLRELSAQPMEVPIDRVQGRMRALEEERGVILDGLQRDAVLGAFENGTLIITGGPGTGKTTIIKFIIELFELHGIEAVLCAPTGRAAKRMSEATGKEARTIHRLLEYDGDKFNVTKDNPLEARCIIVDEMSMVDAWLFYALLVALEKGTRLIMVGDCDQLPSVGAGNVLMDMIASDVLPVVRLTEIFRQARQSRIVTNAHLINHGEMPELDFTDDFGFEQISSPEDTLTRLTGMLARGRLGDPFTQVQVLTPMKKGVLGVYNINRCLQAALNPPAPEKQEKEMGETVLRKGDKVMQIKNNYQLEWVKPKADGLELGMGVFNGDMGTIADINLSDRTLELEFDDMRRAFYDFTQLEELELAYCISIHKSQGSEFDTVVLPLCTGPPMLFTRNLLYTAITRARSRVIILGRRSAIDIMVRNNKQTERYSGLAHFIKALDVIYS